MVKVRTNTVLNVCIIISLLVLFHALSTQDKVNKKTKSNSKDESSHTKSSHKIRNTDYNIWLIFTKVTNVSTLSY